MASSKIRRRRAARRGARDKQGDHPGAAAAVDSHRRSFSWVSILLMVLGGAAWVMLFLWVWKGGAQQQQLQQQDGGTDDETPAQNRRNMRQMLQGYEYDPSNVLEHCNVNSPKADEFLEGYLNDVESPLPGYHVFCVVPELVGEQGVRLHMAAFAEGTRSNPVSSTGNTTLLDWGESAVDVKWMKHVRADIEHVLGPFMKRSDARVLQRRRTALAARQRRRKLASGEFDSKRYFSQQWRVFDAESGQPVTNVRKDIVDPFFATAAAAEATIRPRLMLVFEGGQWIWPGVRKGYRRTLQIQNVTVVLETEEMIPLVMSMNNLLTPEECEHIIGLSSPHMADSDVSFMDHDIGKPATQFRTSTTYFLPSSTKALKNMDVRMALLTRTRVHQQEQVQVLRYLEGQHYGAHLDYWDPRYYKSDPRFLEQIFGGHHNRLVTVLWYMSDVEEGGETNFPRAGGLSHPRNTQSCKQNDGVRYGYFSKPIKGMVTLFYSLKPDGSFDEYSLHAACAVKRGLKWAANKWIHNHPEVHLIRDDPLPGYDFRDPSTWDRAVLGF